MSKSNKKKNALPPNSPATLRSAAFFKNMTSSERRLSSQQQLPSLSEMAVTSASAKPREPLLLLSEGPSLPSSPSIPQTLPVDQAQILPLDQFTQLMATIKEGNLSICASFTTQFQQLEVSFGLLKADMGAMAERVSAQEVEVSRLSQEVSRLHIREDLLTVELQQCREALEGLEKYSHRNNLRITGIREGVEDGRSFEGLVENILKEAYDWDPGMGELVIDAAHRIPANKNKNPVGSTPRTTIVKVLNHSHKDRLLQLSRGKRDANHQGDILNLYMDQTSRVKKKRLSFWETKKILREKAVQYSTVKEATLRVIYKGKAFFFDDPVQAKDYALSLITERVVGPEVVPGGLGGDSGGNEGVWKGGGSNRSE